MFTQTLIHLLIFYVLKSDCMLYTKGTESREVRELGGIWQFRADTSDGRNLGFEKQWYTRPLAMTGDVIDMPVPSSFNDITQDRMLRDFVGWVWYEKNFFPPRTWKTAKQRIFLKFESAHYNSIVWLNGKQVAAHEGGHLPFQAEVTHLLNFGYSNRLTAAINNTLTPYTLPPGTITYPKHQSHYPKGYFVQNFQTDFFNYAGIHRPVKLYTTPMLYISDITVVTKISGTTGIVNYNIRVEGASSPVTYTIRLFDAEGMKVAVGQKASGQLNVSNAHLWWPCTMSEHPAYLYTLKVKIEDGSDEDMYDVAVGIRTVEVTKTKFLINGKPFYFLGVGKHEDADIRGKGLDYPTMIKDLNLMKWLGINSFRTSHYPYAEEIMDLCDRHGIVVIDESTAVGMKTVDNFSDTTLQHHLAVMEELVTRDKNHPSVVMWSVANEPNATLVEAGAYFKRVVDYTRTLDGTRPVTLVTGGNLKPEFDNAAMYGDVICLNTYFSWYGNPGRLEVIQYQASTNLRAWFEKFQRPVIQAEYGSDALPGLHTDPPMMFSEEYQIDLLTEYFKVFDEVRSEFFVGEMIWNFADFSTAQTNALIGARNMKGILTRQRQPKSAARIIKKRYYQIGNTTVQTHNKESKIYIFSIKSIPVA
ncbi:beta-glucuronidase-like [Anneissia japonica]|uniref:beta-glucuronidase-like n=1 Tax=Anneissia japonica TaxID=1529436 RepID=UPI001425B5A0|nr:beta-glucuronidase-like [Anneissia japonica]